MNEYRSFAKFYDVLTRNINYTARARYFDELIRRFHPDAGLLLDLACGTGSLAVEFAALGYDVIGADGSAEMLTAAMEKKVSRGLDITLLHQNMQELDLYGTVDVTVCALDSINHITDPEELRGVFARVALFTNPGGLFVFDANTVYKHREILGNQVYLYDEPEVCCVWQNQLDPESEITQITLDFFLPRDDGSDLYERETEIIFERGYSDGELTELLRAAGFSLEAVFSEDRFSSPEPTEQRKIFVARKK